MLTPDMERANALVDVQSLLAKADLILQRKLPDLDIHVHGWDNGRPGSTATVRPRAFSEGVQLRPKP